jgi:hypothetical protein
VAHCRVTLGEYHKIKPNERLAAMHKLQPARVL